ncbi:MAG: hypothetical protein WCF65_04525 [Parachlamydiaceae bacterium]
MGMSFEGWKLGYLHNLHKNPTFHPSKLIPIKILLLYPAYPVKLPHTTRCHTNVAILQNSDRKFTLWR